MRNTIVSLLSALTLLVVPVAVPALVSAASINDNLCTGATLSTTATTCGSSTSAGTNSINSIITNIVNIFSLVVGITAVVMIIFGGFRYITSGGDSNNVSSAKNTIIYAIIGLVIVALAQFIVQFVLNKVTQ
jgi:cytochrome bd-type quinol oxidase subunit 2